jgi:eukaryotic-like serine/threonine-protein kinase
MALAIGTRLEHYEIVDTIGAGGMGEVYRARDTKLGRDVAFKVLPDLYASDPDRLSRFQREAQLLASLNHPNIAQIYGVVESAGTRGIVMELVQGETLQTRLKRGPVPPEEALRIATQVAEGLEAAHDNGIVHRDLKPGNIMVSVEGHVKVLDFGLAKALEAQAGDLNFSNSPTVLSRDNTQTNVVMGTAAYMSPEQLRGRTADVRSDIWAFGCVVYEVLCGQQTFSGETMTDLIAGIVRAEPEWNLLPSATPAALRSVLARCLEKDRRRRYHAIGDVRLDLEASPTIGAAPAAGVRRGRERVAWSIAGGVAIAAIGLLAAMGYWASRGPQPHVARFLVEFPPDVSLGSAGAAPFPTISPDGQYAAFDGVISGTGRLWLRPIGSLASQPIAGTEFAGSSNAQSFWSPDSRSIGFFAAGKLKRVAVVGGPPQILCDAGGDAISGTWSQNDVIVFERDGVLHRVRAAGGVSTPIRTPDKSRNERAYKHPAFLPDGKHFLYVALSSEPGRSEARVGSLDSNVDQPLFANYSKVLYSDPGYLLFVKDGTLMAQAFDPGSLKTKGDIFPVAESVASLVGNGTAAFSVSKTGTLLYRNTGAGSSTELAWFDRSGKKTGSVPTVGSVSRPYLSPDQTFIAMQRNDGQSADIWLIDRVRGTNSRLTLDSGDETYPVVSPNGKQVAYTSTRDGKLGFYIKSASGVGAEELIATVQGGDPAITDWSPDGKLLLYGFMAGETQWDSWAVEVTGERKAFPVLNQKFNDYRARFSPDGHWISYTSNETGRQEIYVQGFPPSGEKKQISVDGGNYAYWRQDGREIIFDSADGKMMAVDIKLGTPLQVGVPRELFKLPGLIYSSRYAITPDAQRLLFPLAPQSSDRPTITIVLNWTLDLRK